MARPSSYNPEKHDQLIRIMCKSGYTDVQMCKELGITEPTINKWKKDFPELFKSIKEIKKLGDQDIVVSLRERAKGYSYTEEMIDYDKDGKVTKRRVFKKHSPPEVRAIEFWLRNRQREDWRDTKYMDFEDNELNINIKFE